jgi:diketogulonate reductase-like aldo/keto reductase
MICYIELLTICGFPSQAVDKVAERRGVSKQTVVFGWLLHRGVFPLVKCRGAHIQENVEAPAALQSQLTPEDLEELAGAEAPAAPEGILAAAGVQLNSD